MRAGRRLRSERCSGTRRIGTSSAVYPSGRRARATGRRVVVIGAGPSGLACAGELAARGILRGRVRRARGARRARPLCNRPLSPGARPASRRSARAGGARRRASARTRIDSRQELETAAEDADAVFLGVGLGADTNVSSPGDELRGVWESLPFIEAIKTGQPPKVGRHVVVIGGGNTAIDVAREALRLGADDVTVLYRRTEAEMPAYDARDRGGARRRHPVPFPRGARRIPRDLGPGADRVRRDDARRARRKRSSPPHAAAGLDIHASGLHGRQGDRPAVARRTADGSRGSSSTGARSSSTDRDAPETASSSPAVTRSTAARASSRLCATEGAPPMRSKGASMPELTEIRWHARAGQGAKTASQMLALALLSRAAASRRSPSTAPSAEGRRFARTPGSPTGRSGATTRSSILTSSSSSSRRSCARPA